MADSNITKTALAGALRELIERACEHFYQNRGFYRKALAVRGQNSLSDHMREHLSPLIKIRVANSLSSRRNSWRLR